MALLVFFSFLFFFTIVLAKSAPSLVSVHERKNAIAFMKKMFGGTVKSHEDKPYMSVLFSLFTGVEY